jgi:hypothetical protein
MAEARKKSELPSPFYTFEAAVKPKRIEIEIGSLTINLVDGITTIMLDGKPLRGLRSIKISKQMRDPWRVELEGFVTTAEGKFLAR